MAQRERRRTIWGALLAGIGGGLIGALRHRVEVERATDALTAEAQRQIGLQYETADAQDLKTLGMIAASIAAAAFVASAQHDWRAIYGVPVWLAPLLLESLAVVAFVLSLWQQSFQRGPRVANLYREFSGTMMEAKGLILRELVEALDHNRSLLPAKARRYAAGSWLLAGAAVTTAIALVLSRV